MKVIIDSPDKQFTGGLPRVFTIPDDADWHTNQPFDGWVRVMHPPVPKVRVPPGPPLRMPDDYLRDIPKASVPPLTPYREWWLNTEYIAAVVPDDALPACLPGEDLPVLQGVDPVR